MKIRITMLATSFFLNDEVLCQNMEKIVKKKWKTFLQRKCLTFYNNVTTSLRSLTNSQTSLYGYQQFKLWYLSCWDKYPSKFNQTGISLFISSYKGQKALANCYKKLRTPRASFCPSIRLKTYFGQQNNLKELLFTQ